MINNDVLRSVRYMLNINEEKMVEIIALTDFAVQAGAMAAFLKKDEEEGYRECPDEVLGHFLNGLVMHKRGRDDSRPPQPLELPMTNNIVLKKLRVAFNLKEDDMFAIFEGAGFKVGKPELSSFFRKEGQKNYRPCGDQFLRNFLKGLTLRVRT
ncbi:MAG: DUF1456 family protein [Moraxellaceae bacterium]|nr:DUF1456 family protein [Moraxellaceae bacterium]